jgi:L-alanine-DL-glutamate epimerase-like enolase superfamily enzyme
LKTPVYTLLNGKFRDKIPIASEIGIDDPDAMAENALRVLDLGIPVIIIKGSREYEKDIQRIKVVRKAVGDDVKLRLDPNAAWPTSETIRVMKEVEDCNLEFLEQPVDGKNLDGMAWVRKNINIPLMADESIWDHNDVVSIFEKKAADIINIKIAKSCGLLGAKKIEHVSDATGMTCLTGTEIEPGMSIAAKIHLAASIRNLVYACEFTELSLINESLLQPKIEIEDGYITVPDGDGFGFDIDEDLLEKYRVNLPGNRI